MKTLMSTLNWRENSIMHPKGIDNKISENKPNDFSASQIQNYDINYQEVLNDLNGN